MFKRHSPGGMSGILRFNILAATGCATYYFWSKYSSRKSLQAEYCTQALQLVQDYPQMQQILGKQIRLTKLVTRREADQFTDLSQLAGSGPNRQIRVKCELQGSKSSGLLYVYASSTDSPGSATKPDSSQPDDAAEMRPSILSIQPSSNLSKGWAIDRLDLQLTGSGKPSALTQRWTLFESFARRRAATKELPIAG
uniref:Cytochrome oxidase assembly n=1 Tax=Macrostomum lignano TaxID=282301 RepID=A0A1I8HCG9_9PLAT